MSVDNINQERFQTREEYKRAKAAEVPHAHAGQERGTAVRAAAETGESRHAVQEQKAAAAEKERPKQRVRIRMIPIWLRLVLLVVLAAVCLTAGAVVGYSVLGGENAADVFSGSAWTHIRDLVEKK
ncbi:DNA-directed RNA polymerase subunit beta [Neobacillus muris]|uniref:DNA-directed RNA polymerase subunit beta n=1 Tax=Neobacillus muris TaxID=2941334 RepID=UPI00203F7318|nr:DNA-directed RNA polymerase subunit beta [Neobacillus muris]